MEILWAYLFLIISSLGFIVYKRWKKDPIIRIDWMALAQFVGFMAIITMIRFCLADIFMMFFPEDVTTYVDAIKERISVGTVLFVFWEDIWFAMPIAWIMKNIHGKSKWASKIAITMVILISVVFGMAHLYQGWFAFIACLYPFFISRHYGEKYGFGTVMLAHMFYDFITLMTIKNMHLLL